MLNPKGANRKFYYAELVNDYRSNDHDYNESDSTDANLVSSLCDDGFHRPALDLDLPGEIFQSSTPGHCHLYIDKPMTWQKYVVLMQALVDAGLLEKAYLDHCMTRRMSMLRLPHIRKQPAPINTENSPSPEVGYNHKCGSYDGMICLGCALDAH